MSPPEVTPRDITALHVDDDPDFATLAQQSLQHLSDDITVVTAHSVETALTHLNGSEEIDCVISDYEMPDSDGLDLLRTVRTEWPDLPFILFTGKGSEEIAEKAIQLGVTDYLQKGTGPSQFSLLANRIHNLVEKHRAESQLELVNQRTGTQFELLVDTVKEYAIFLLDEDGTVQTWNAGGEKIKGYRAPEIIGEHFSRFYRPEDVAAGVPERNLRTAATDGEFLDTDWRVRKDGSEFWADVTITALYDNGDLCGFAKVTRDTTAQHEEQEYLKQNRKLKFIIKTLSHDLKSPLSVASGRIQLARETDELSHLDEATEALNRVNELFEYLRQLALAEESDLNREPVELGEVVRASWEAINNEAADLVVDVDGVIRVNPRWLQLLLENLFENAIEHGGADVTVTVGLLEEGGFYVADTGPGIPEEERENVFDLGYTTRESGTGFGLNISEYLVETHGWRIDVTGSDEGGSRFEITGVRFEDTEGSAAQDERA